MDAPLVEVVWPTMSSSAQDLLPQVDLGNTFGALFIGVALSAVFVNYFLTMRSILNICRCNSLFGLTNVQIFIYFQTHRDTKMTFFKLIVRASCYIRLSGFGKCPFEL
jgi:hypothetical protein